MTKQKFKSVKCKKQGKPEYMTDSYVEVDMAFGLLPNLPKIKTIFKAPTESFARFGVQGGTKTYPYYYKDNGSKILAIAHLDTVKDEDFFALCWTGFPWGPTFFNPKLDDRLGCYILLYVLPKLGIKYDLLLTTGEEAGRSSGENFAKEMKNKWNWMFQFDRMGTDVATYMYGDAQVTEDLKKVELESVYGLASDISKMTALGIKGFNFGCAYYDHHSRMAFCAYDLLIKQIIKFKHFYNLFKEKAMPHKEVQIHYDRDMYIGYGSRKTTEKSGYSDWNLSYTKSIINDKKQVLYLRSPVSHPHGYFTKTGSFVYTCSKKVEADRTITQVIICPKCHYKVTCKDTIHSVYCDVCRYDLTFWFGSTRYNTLVAHCKACNRRIFVERYRISKPNSFYTCQCGAHFSITHMGNTQTNLSLFEGGTKTSDEDFCSF